METTVIKFLYFKIVLICLMTISSVIYHVATQNMGSGQSPGYSTTLETNLRTQLFTTNSYEKLQRPAMKVDVRVTLNVITINYLDIKSQTLSVSAYFGMEWDDSRLDWSTDTTYSNIPFLFSNEDYMWRPTILVENSVSDMSVLSDEDFLMRVNNIGRVSWTPGGVFSTACEADVTYYPMDIQECSIIISTWAYTSNEVELHFPASGPIKLTNFKENGEWEIKGYSNSSTTGTREDQSFSRLYYTLTLRRRPLFHILNTLFPVLLMALLTIFVFKLPPDSGERVTLSLTVLLAYAVYLTLIAESVPTTSLSASVLSVYLTIILMISALSVIFTIFVLDIYFNYEEEESVPDWAQKLTRSVLAPLACWHVKCGSRRQVSPADYEEKNSDGKNSVSTVTTVNPTLNNNTSRHRRPAAKMRGKVKILPDEKLGREESNVSSGDERQYTWKDIALILDRCFMYLFMLLVGIPSIICLALMAAHYQDYTE